MKIKISSCLFNLFFYFEWFPKKKSEVARIYFTHNNEKVVKMDMKVDVSQGFKVVEEDKFDNVVSVPFDADPAAVWGLDDPSFGAVVAADDMMSAVVTPSGKLGACNLQFSCSIGGKQFAGSLPLNMLPGDVAEIVISPA